MIDQNLNEQLKGAVSFIKGLLSEEADAIVDESDSEELSSISFKNSITDSSFHTFEPTEDLFKLAAVDGGSQRILNGGSFIIGAYRAGSLVFHGNDLLNFEPSPGVKVRSISFENRKELYSTIFQDLIGESPSDYPRELSLMLQRLRTFEEWSVAKQLIDQLEKDDIILVDGSLKASINKLDILFQYIMTRALEKGIHFVGVSKRSTLRFNHAPLIRYVKRKGDELFSPNQTWYCEIPDEKGHHQMFGKRYIVKFHPKSLFVFRTDINRLDDTPPGDVFAKIAQYCSDATYLGYPYPLAHIHNKVVINRPIIEDINYRLESIALEHGVSQSNWDDLFEDFHRILDKNL
ncbi:MAG: DNA double-strand break repair nuclease NurA [Planctomycetota bacterium]|jgi:hypothetical protein